MKEAKSKIFRRSKAHTMYVSIPSEIVKDSRFPFSLDGETVTVTIKGNSLVITKQE